MKKLSKLFVCIALVFGLTFGLTACTAKDVEENTRTAVETTTSIVPVEFTKETAEGILHNALYTMLSSDKLEMSVKEFVSVGAVEYTESTFNQKILIEDGKRYVYFVDTRSDENTEYVIGTYNNKDCILNLDSKKYNEVTAVAETSGGDETEEIAPIAQSLITRLDLITSLVAAISDNTVSGRYFNGATYINIQPYDDCYGSMEAKIVDGKIVSIAAFAHEDTATMWGCYTFTYGDAVDVSMIPASLNGFTKAALNQVIPVI